MNISVIVPVYNDKTIVQCLEHLMACDTDGLWREIIVVDNNSEPWVREVVQQFPVNYIHEQQQGAYAARNAGMRHAKGDVLAFLDADCFAARDWLQVIAHVFHDDAIDGVTGFSCGSGTSRVALLEQRMHEENVARFTTTRKQVVKHTLERIDTRNAAIHRRAMQRIGMFNDALRFGGDWEYGARMHAAGFRIFFAPRMIITHEHPKHLWPLLRKRLRQNAGNMTILTFHDAAFSQHYFPAWYTVATTSRRKQILYRCLYTLLFWTLTPLTAVIIHLIPLRPAYVFFKATVVCAIRLGQLNGLRKRR